MISTPKPWTSSERDAMSSCVDSWARGIFQIWGLLVASKDEDKPSEVNLQGFPKAVSSPTLSVAQSLRGTSITMAFFVPILF